MATTTDKINTPVEQRESPSSQREASPQFDSHQLLTEHGSLPRTVESTGLPDLQIAGLEATKHRNSEHHEQHSTRHKGKTGDKAPLAETETVAHGDTIEQMARKRLGKGASKAEVEQYTYAIATANQTFSARPDDGTKIVLPGRNKHGDFVYNNPQNRDEHVTFHKKLAYDAVNTKDGTSYHHQYLDMQSLSYVRDYKGPKQADNYREAYFEKNQYTFKETKDADGTIHDIGSDGTTRDKDPSGNWKIQYGPLSANKDSSFDAKSQTTVSTTIDGAIITTTKDNTATLVDSDGTKTVQNTDAGTTSVETKDAQGNEISTQRVQKDDGGYTLDGKGAKPSDNFHETYDPQTGETVRTEGRGTPEERTTTHSADGTIKVEAKDGDNYQRNLDGSEYHWGNKTFDKPPYDYENDSAMNQSRTELDQSVKDHIPKDQQADFSKDMANFEIRAQKDHLPPDEITKTYAQMNRLLNAKDSDAVVPEGNRALLAEQLMHQTAHPDDSSQGTHETCNVTTVAKETLAKNPFKMAEVATSTALTGKFTAPDGKVISVDKQSLEPGAEESNVKPVDGQRSYATQVLNLALVNDTLQRRSPPETYAQRTPDRTIPGDTGERRMDSTGRVETGSLPRQDANGNIKFIDGPLNDPGITDHEIKMEGRAFNGETNHLIETSENSNPSGGIDMVKSADDLGHRLQQYKDQGQMPVSLGVDANHAPIANDQDETPGYGSHIVNITDYNAKTGQVMVSNNWDSAHNRWVDLNDLYSNSSGKFANAKDGTDITWPDEL